MNKKNQEALIPDLSSHDYIKSNRYALKELAKKIARKYGLTVQKLCLMIGQRKEYIEASCDKYSFNKKGDLTSCQISEIKNRIEHVDNYLNRHLERNPELEIHFLFEKYITEHKYKKSKFDPSSKGLNKEESMKAFFFAYESINGDVRGKNKVELLEWFGDFVEGHPKDPESYNVNDIFITVASAATGIPEDEFLLYALEYFGHTKSKVNLEEI